MNNYKVHIQHGTVDFTVMVRGYSQEDAEKYIQDHPEDLQGLRVSDSPFIVLKN